MSTEVQEPDLLSSPSDPIEVEFSLSIDTSVYPREAVFRTCYAFTDRYYIWLKRVAEGHVISVNFARKNLSSNIQELKGEFANALIDFTLRDNIERQTRNIRTTIISAALAEASRRPVKPS